MKILVLSDAPWCQNGFGNNLRNILPALAKHHQVSVQCIDDSIILRGCTNWNGIECFANKWSFGEFLVTPSLFEATERRFYSMGADILFVYMDSWLLTSKFENTAMPFVTHAPIDGDPPSPFTILSMMKAKKIVAMCEWSERLLREQYHLPSVVIPHGVDPLIYYPPSDNEYKMVCRRNLGIPEDKFVFTDVGANIGTRKSFPETMEAFSIFSKKHSDVVLFIHADPLSSSGYNLANLANIFKISDKVVFSSNLHMSDREIGDIYRASDVLLNCSQGEGFGRTIIEAAACGVPSIVTDFTSMSELVEGGRGLKVDVAAKQCQRLNYTFYGIPSVSGIAKNMEMYYSDRALLSEHSKRCKEVTVDRFGWDKVNKLWLKLFEEV